MTGAFHLRLTIGLLMYHARPDGFGDMDIYRLVFNDLQRYAIVRGKVITGDTGKLIEATITATNVKTKDQLTFKPVPRNGHYVMALTPGVYSIQITSNLITTYI